MYNVKILCDSISGAGVRLTTFELTYPRFVHAEVLTHKMFARNASSSRAIPAATVRRRVMEDPAMPVYWGQNQKGMQASTEVDDIVAAREWWLEGMRLMTEHHKRGEELGIHKQLVNRIIEPWAHITVILTATEFENFFHLRCHPDAQPELQKIAYMMREQYRAAKPTVLAPGRWHLPLVSAEDRAEALEKMGTLKDAETMLCAVSTGRCARVSYLTHDGKRDMLADIELHDRLMTSGHWSPFESVAKALGPEGRNFRSGNLTGWEQYRKTFTGENITEPK